jgi:protein-tyrosine phosphatase
MYLLNEISKMSAVPGLHVPDKFYWIFDGEAPLAGMEYPSPNTPWERLRMLGFRYVINLETTRPRYDPQPLRVLEAIQLEDLIHGGDPLDSAREQKLISKTVNLIVENRKPDSGIIVHCIGGRGRTGTVLGCYLRAIGFSSEQIIADLNRLHKSRGKNGWPESCWQEQMVRSYPSSLGDR